jgi:nicotinamidase-related amidase
MMRPALLVIDLQRWFLEVGSPEKLARVGALIANTNALIDFFRDRDLPVVRIQTVHKADGSTWNQWMKEHNAPRLIEGTWEVEEHPDVHRCDTDVVIRKTRHSAFIRTELEEVLRARAIDTVVLAGFSTDACVGLTTIEAYERDFKIMLAEDAILGTNQKEGSLMLDYLRNRFAIEPVPNARIMETVSGHMGH